MKRSPMGKSILSSKVERGSCCTVCIEKKQAQENDFGGRSDVSKMTLFLIWMEDVIALVDSHIEPHCT